MRPGDKTKVGPTRANPPVPAINPSADVTLVRSNDGGDSTRVHGGDGGEATMVHGSKAAPPARAPAGASTAESAPLPKATSGQVFAGRFEVVRLLGEGGMGKVYEVRDRQIEGRAVALKVLLPKLSKSEQFRKLFFQEIRAAQKFVSEHVIQVRDTGQMDDGSLFLTMDLVDGESLRALLDREKVLRARHGLEIGRQTLNGLQSGHEQGFIHRDIKPPNVMLAAKVPKTDENPYGVGVRILDFGIAGLAADVGESKAGTAMYMSPEQVKGERLDARSDLFAVGVMLYEMLSGARPFSGKTTREVMDSVIETNLAGKVAEIEDLSPAVRRILERALQKDREKRFQSAAEFAEAIAKSSAYQIPRVMPLWALGALGGLAVVALGEGALLWTNSSKQEELRAQIAQAGNDKQDALRNVESVNEQKIRALQNKYDELVNDRDRLDRWKTERESAEKIANERKTTDTKLEETELRRLGDRLKEVERERDQAQTEREQFRTSLTSVSDKVSKLEERATAAEKLNEKLRQEATDVAKTAAAFDTLFKLVENNLGRNAERNLEDLQKTGIFAHEDLEGASYVRAVVACASGLQTFRDSQKPGARLDLAALVHAKDEFSKATELQPSFAQLAVGWIGIVLDTGNEEQRAQRAQAVLTKLRGDVDEASRSVEDSRRSEWARVDALPATQDPSTAFGLANLYGDDALAPLAQRFVAELRSTSTNEKLDLNKLAGLGFLGAWADRASAGHVPLPAADARDLQLYRCAQRWYDNDDTNDDFKLDDAAMGNITGPGNDWRTELYLQWKLGLALTGAKGGRTLIYRQVNAQKEVNWWQDKWVATPGAATPSSWTTNRRILRENAIDLLSDTLVTLERRGKRLMIAGSDAQIVDLRATGNSVYVAPYPTLWVGDLPRQLQQSQLNLEQFRREVGAGTGPCLVYVQGEITRWFSPSFGLVREETRVSAGMIVRELVFASPAP